MILHMFTLILAILFLVPFYYVIINSVKEYAAILSNSSALPSPVILDNFRKAWTIMDFPKVFANSVMITVFSNIGLIVMSSMAAYKMVRSPGKIVSFLFILFTAAMVIPFQSIMITLVKVANMADLINSRTGLIICYFGFGLPLNLFLYHGFIKSISREIEESAVVDGCSTYGVFWRIVFPLLKPMTVTIVLLNSLWIWNDYLLPSLILNGKELQTIPLATYNFFGQYTKQWDLALAALVLGVAPIVLLFLFMQKQIVEGITAGSVKG
ncbi:carbohydrate ABC transporter permease [Paenibacillus caui]|uniref:carbohydrate ABC transporter permease n=1 Tax=Paenibacillus caui TaxID=2873927 RepID=UPI001CA94A74|nr:carbohydrate ABC transporter permease [Paenibacillus caui]